MHTVFKRKMSAIALSFCLAGSIGIASAAPSIPDIPPCEALETGSSAPLSIGVVQPYASPEVVQYAAKLATRNAQVTVCSESWSAVLPRFAPWAGQLERGHGWVIFILLMFAVVGVLTAYTPRQWWRRTTLIGILAIGGLTWLSSIATLAAVHALGGQRLLYGTVVSLRAAQQAEAQWINVGGARDLEAALAQRHLLPDASVKSSASDSVAIAIIKPLPEGRYGVFHRVNLREKPGVESPRIAVLPIGDEVIFDGAVEGDWWRIRAKNGQSGWVNSIWLRRPEELKTITPAAQS